MDSSSPASNRFRRSLHVPHSQAPHGTGAAKVVLNVNLTLKSEYQQPQPDFHQFKDPIAQKIFGLRFASENDGSTFAIMVSKVLQGSNSDQNLQQAQPSSGANLAGGN